MFMQGNSAKIIPKVLRSCKVDPSEVHAAITRPIIVFAIMASSTQL